MGEKFLTSSFQMIRFDEKNGFTLLEEMRECIFRYRNGLKFAQGVLESMILSRRSALGEICDRMPFQSLFPWTRTSPPKPKAPTDREQIGTTSRVPLSEIETVEETVKTKNATCNEEREASDIDAITKQDVATVTNEIESTDNSETEMNQQLIDLKSKLEKANQRIESLQKQMFTVDRFRGDDSSIKFYTGFPNWDTFDAVFKYLNPGNEGQNIPYCVSKLNLNVSAAVYGGENEEVIRKRGRSRSLKPIDEFFAVMCRLWQGFAEDDSMRHHYLARITP